MRPLSTLLLVLFALSSGFAQTAGQSAIQKKNAGAGFSLESFTLGNSQIIGRTSGGVMSGITLGSGLTLTGATLSAASGSVTLAGLTDVELTFIAGGHLLQYNSETGKWYNVVLQDVIGDRLHAFYSLADATGVLTNDGAGVFSYTSTSTGGNGDDDEGKLVTYGNNGLLSGTGIKAKAYGIGAGSLQLEAAGGASIASISFSPAIGQTTSDVFRIAGRGEGAVGFGYILTDSSHLDATKLVNELSLARIGQNGATSGQALAWNGTAWAPATITGASPSGSGSELQYRSGASTFGAVPGSSVSSGAITLGTNGAASTPPLTLSGTWFTGGTSTTTKPQLLIESSGTTSTSWSTNGTGLGINAASGFTGKLIDAQVNGTSAFSYTYNYGTRGLLSLGSAGGAAIAIYADTGKVSFASSVQATNGTYYVSSDLADSSGAFVGRNYGETTTHFVLASDGDAVAATMQLGLDHSITATGQTIKAHDVTTGTGASLTLAGGKGSVAGGDLVLATSTTNGAPAARLTVKASGVLNAAGMPTSSAGLASGDLWNDSGTVKIVP